MPPVGPRLVRLGECGAAQAVVHRIEGSGQAVVELLAFGAAYASRYVLLRRGGDAERVLAGEPGVLARLRQGGASLGRILKGSELAYDPQERCLRVQLEQAGGEPGGAAP